MWDYPKYGCPGKHGDNYYYYYNTGLQNQRYLNACHAEYFLRVTLLSNFYPVKVAPHLCGKITLCFIKVRVILTFCTSIGVHKKPSRLSTNLYDQIYFDRWDQFYPSMVLSDTGSNNSGQTSLYSCVIH